MSANHYPRKRFGQHFLSDAATISRIIDAIAPDAKDIIVEIGPGKGALTYPLLKEVSQIHAVEIDRDLARLLKQQCRSVANLHIHCTDALRMDFAELLGEKRARFVGNLPYNISTPLIFRLAEFHAHIIDMHLMLQREVVQRLIASATDKRYGRLSVIAKCCFEINALFDVAPQSFTPSPQVVSSFAYFKPQPELCLSSLEALDKIVRRAFSGRRKTSANAFAGLLDKETLEVLGIDPNRRADRIEPSQFLCMLKYLSNTGGEDVTE